jgi:hypothetical protein
LAEVVLTDLPIFCLRQRQLNQRASKIDFSPHNCRMPALANQPERRVYAGFLQPGRP